MTEFKTWYAEHTGGTKCYRIYIVEKSDADCMVMYQWGKVGTTGQHGIEYGDRTKIYGLARDKAKVKRDNGYDLQLDRSVTRNQIEKMIRVSSPAAAAWLDIGAIPTHAPYVEPVKTVVVEVDRTGDEYWGTW